MKINPQIFREYDIRGLAGVDLDEASVRGCVARLRPILMTAGTTILGLLPLAVFHGAHVGDAEYYPIARAISGGALFFSGALMTALETGPWYLFGASTLGLLALVIGAWLMFRSGRT